jgi:hypothetical protein
MILDKEIEIVANNYIINYYRNKGYKLETNQKFLVKIEDLMETSKQNIRAICDVCNNQKNVKYYLYLKSVKNGGIYTCSNKCSIEKRKNTNLERYGSEHHMNNDNVKNKIKETNIGKYGVENVSQNEDIKNKRKETNLERYGVSCSLQSNETKTKTKSTNLERYGVENVFQNEEIKQKSKETILEKYGVHHISYSEEIKNKRKNTNIERYGVEFSQSSDYVRNKIKYGNSKYNIEKFQKEYLNNITYQFIDSFENNLKFIHLECGNYFDISPNNHNNIKKLNIPLCSICYPINDTKYIKEKELDNWLNDLNVDFIDNDKTILEGKELDIYIPSNNLAIEFNGLYWHSELFKEKDYHLSKSLKCQDKDIHLMHIWEDEWIFKQDIVKSIILNKLNKIENKIFARKCSIKEVKDSKLVRQFLDTNHIQGYSQSSIKLGLYYNDILVSLMTFGYRHTNSKKEFELIRFCNILNTNVIGASSKLFKYFLNNYQYETILSYSDFRLFDGKMYETLGFEKIHLSVPDYFWSKGIERKHRFTFNKQKLIKDGYDASKTEVEIMHERGYSRIWSCGQIRWIYKNI